MRLLLVAWFGAGTAAAGGPLAEAAEGCVEFAVEADGIRRLSVVEDAGAVWSRLATAPVPRRLCRLGLCVAVDCVWKLQTRVGTARGRLRAAIARSAIPNRLVEQSEPVRLASGRSGALGPRHRVAASGMQEEVERAELRESRAADGER